MIVMEEDKNTIKELNKHVTETLRDENTKSTRLFTLCTTLLTAFLIVTGFILQLAIKDETLWPYVGILIVTSIILLISVLISATCFFDAIYYPTGVERYFWVFSLIISKLIGIDGKKAKKLLILKNSLKISGGIYSNIFDTEMISKDIISYRYYEEILIHKIFKNEKFKKYKPTWIPFLNQYKSWKSKKLWDREDNINEKIKYEKSVRKNSIDFINDIVKDKINFKEDWVKNQFKMDIIWKSYLISARWKLRKYAIFTLFIGFFSIIVLLLLISSLISIWEYFIVVENIGLYLLFLIIIIYGILDFNCYNIRKYSV